ncbi:hypothetical protein [Neoroseomonas oryzicola]|uniref:Uncharacterized protein n=1 Tax=Neoroseomonas oryzicola TaxID=535904 RepID=A0A9X9WM20_9PROT|nr:hypothetical protein [Neoroseomonas oryzicola]MBR0661380.1 hypothetical protein [Neoroseomonas oryzicola]NKE17453.1 hypothetical protein [Neoroseomonas oryzicola]
MTAIRHDLLERFGTAAYQPATFLDRGVTVPFTTPFLLGARIRPTETRSGLELVISNPAGGRGFYIVPWAAMPEVCSPTLHDRRLWQRLSDQTAVTPSLVRETARAVAAEGLAGRAAAAAVAEARGAESAARMRANFLLLLDLIRRTETREEAAIPPQSDTPQNIESRARRAVARFAPRIGVSAEIVAAWLEALAAAFCGVGVPGDRTVSRTRALVAGLRRMVEEIELWIAQSPDPGEQHAAVLVTDAAKLTLHCADAAFRDLDGLLSDTPTLLRAWREDAAPLGRRATRPDWLLDGWQVICELWRDAEPDTRPGALWEMALLAPVMPREVEDWLGVTEDWDRPTRLRRLVRANEDWRSGRMIEIVARNERLRARAA